MNMNTLLRRFCLLSLLTALVFSPTANGYPQETASPAPSPEALQMAQKLMEVTHANASVVQVIDVISKQLLPLLVKANPDKQQLVQTFFEQYFVPVFKQHANEFTDQAAFMYAQNFTVEDMQSVIAFYQSPAGQKFVNKAPQMREQMMLKGQVIGQRLGAEAMQNLVTQMRKNNLQVPKEIGL